MNSLTVTFPEELDQQGLATLLEGIAQCLRADEDLQDRELMDGSIRFETPQGPAFITAETEED